MESADAEYAGNPPTFRQASQAVQGTLPIDYPAAYVDEVITRGQLAIEAIQVQLNTAREILLKLQAEVRKG